MFKRPAAAAAAAAVDGRAHTHTHDPENGSVGNSSDSDHNHAADINMNNDNDNDNKNKNNKKDRIADLTMPSRLDTDEKKSVDSPSRRRGSGSDCDDKVRLLDRLEHFTWAWYTLPMSTGGLALLLSPSTQPHTFLGLATIGKIVYVWDLFVFVSVTASMTYRFARFPGTLHASLTHPTESLFFATPFLSLASIIAGMAPYGIPACGAWLVTTYRVLFWVYFAVTFCQATGQYFVLFTSPLLRIEDMTPAWDLPIFPFMLSGTVAAAGARFQPVDQAVPMIVAGLTAQGLGMLVSLLMYASYFRRMIQFGFPSPNSRPGMFIAVGPPSFTALALMGLANDFASVSMTAAAGGQEKIPPYFGQNVEVTVQIFRAMATVVAVFIWSLSLWFFCLSVLATLARRREMSFHLNWWAFVFPNVGFTIATINVGKMFQSQGVLWVGSVMTVLLVAMYLFVGVAHVRAVWARQILWEGRDEDVYVTERKHKAETLHKKGKEMEAQDLEHGRTS